ncbi:helix-turn-helix domain-containing protein [Streptomyces microflavus]|uniref:helix-turn-helix domain-containing protein n=1 Tax=Streptomyces microflavus TaxID=1919 RepID=UPI00332F1D8E
MTSLTEAPAADEAEGSAEFVEMLRSALQEAVALIVAPPDPELRLYTPAEAAGLLGVTENWVTERVKARRLPCTFVGRFPRFSAQHLRTIAAENEVNPANYGR